MKNEIGRKSPIISSAEKYFLPLIISFIFCVRSFFHLCSCVCVRKIGPKWVRVCVKERVCASTYTWLYGSWSVTVSECIMLAGFVRVCVSCGSVFKGNALKYLGLNFKHMAVRVAIYRRR